MAWNKAVPTSASKVYDLGSELPNNWAAIDSMLSTEHYPLTSGATVGGRHKPGLVGVLFQGTTAETDALSATAASGSLAFDSTTGEGKLFLASQTPNFYPIHMYDRICTYASGSITLGTSTTFATFTQQSILTQSAEDCWVSFTGGNKWVAPVAGYYLVTLRTIPTASPATWITILLRHYLTVGTVKTAITNSVYPTNASGASDAFCESMVLFNMAAGDYIAVTGTLVSGSGTATLGLSIVKVC